MVSNNLSSIALSGMNAAQTSLNIAASNIANANTAGYKRQAVAQTAQAGGGVNTSVEDAGDPGASLETDVVALLQAKNEFLANLAVFKTSAQTTGTLLDKTA